MSPTPKQIEMFSRKAVKSHSKEITALVPLAKELARHAGKKGITVSDLRLAAIARGLLPLDTRGRGRALAYLGAVMRAAGLRSTPEYRRSEIDGAHGNPNKVWVIPDLDIAAVA